MNKYVKIASALQGVLSQGTSSLEKKNAFRLALKIFRTLNTYEDVLLFARDEKNIFPTYREEWHNGLETSFETSGLFAQSLSVIGIREVDGLSGDDFARKFADAVGELLASHSTSDVKGIENAQDSVVSLINSIDIWDR